MLRSSASFASLYRRRVSVIVACDRGAGSVKEGSAGVGAELMRAKNARICICRCNESNRARISASDEGTGVGANLGDSARTEDTETGSAGTLSV